MSSSNNLYCEKCDKWLDSPNDYINKGTDDVGTQYQCKACGSTVEKFIVNSYSICGYCSKKLCDKEWWNKPNWRARMEDKYGISHDFPTDEEARRGEGKITINHDCQPKCSDCGKRYRLTNENVNILVKHFYGNPASCPSCLIETLKERVANNTADEQDKNTLNKLEKLIGGNNDNREREREREREQIQQYFQQHNIKSITLQGDKLLIEYNNRQQETKEADNQELQQTKSYLQKIGKSSIYFSDLETVSSPSNSSNKKTSWPWIIGGTGIAGLVGIIIYFFTRKNKASEEY